MSSFDRILDSEFLEYIVAALFLTAWWAISKTRYTLRRLKGMDDDDGESGGAAVERPRRRLPLY